MSKPLNMKTSLVPIFRTALVLGLALPCANAAVSLDFITVGDGGNAGDTRVMEIDGSTGYGSVTYDFQMARNETTVAQYAAFLNTVAATDTYGLYNPGMSMGIVNGITRSGTSGSYTYSVAPGSGDKPVTFVSWFDAARFCNWLHNGQPSGAQDGTTTENGAYALNGAVSGVSVARSLGATVWIPTEDEWYKAAYYDPAKNGGSGGYWLHANRGDSVSGNTVGQSGAMNFYDGVDFVGYPGPALTDGGAYGSGSASAYGTNDQGGNVFEWNDAVIGESRGLRGGSWDFTEHYLGSNSRNDFDPTEESHNIGFRVASLMSFSAVPEPSSLGMALLASLGLLPRRRR